MRKTIVFDNIEYGLLFGINPDGTTAIQLLDMEDGSYRGTATIYIERSKLEPNEVCIKDYSENTGVHDALVKAEVIAPFHREIPLLFSTAKVCMLLYKKEVNVQG